MFSVQRANLADAAVIADILVRAARFAYAEIGSPEYLNGLNRSRIAGEYSTLLEQAAPNSAVFLGLEDGVPLGFAEVEISSVDDRVGLLQRMFFVPESLGRGLGPVLHKAVLEQLMDWGCTTAELTYVRGNDRARAFYLKQGWTETGEVRPFDDHGRTLTDVVMKRDLR